MGLNILLADDDIDDCLIFREALDELALDASLKTVHNGDQLMQHFDTVLPNLPHALFLDLNMPRKDGFECLTEIKQHKKLKTLPVVIFSTSNVHDEISAVFKTGADVYIRKPRSFEQLVKVIQHAMHMATENIVANGKLKYVLNA